MNDRSRQLASLARQVVAVCGPRRILHVGAQDGAFVGELLAVGGDAFGLMNSATAAAAANESWSNRFEHGLIGDASTSGHETVVVSDWFDDLDDDGVTAALRDLYRASARFAVLAVAATPRPREWWESRCFAAGFRKHAAYYQLNAYASLNQDGAQLIVPLEKVPTGALAEFSMERLQQNRLLHMDMLRETGRRGDAHCFRYHEAARHVRPGDTVLDLACGYGYGSHILFQNSQAASVLGMDLDDDAIAYAKANYARDGAVGFACGNAQDLAGVEDHSVDFIASFETIEHLPDPAAYLDELKRVLRPAGRVMLCAPNDWSDETGRDPNPHHLHVYTWERLRREVGERFLLEKGYVQTAGGAMKCHHSPRSFFEVPLSPLEREAEWILLLGMTDPVGAEAVPYRETAFDVPDDPGFHVSAFARDYDNPWLVKGMIALGMRSENPAVLRAMQEAVLERAAPNSVDYGAALCGRVYAAIADPPDTAGYESLHAAIQAYAAMAEVGPHHIRWQISLLFAGGELARRRGDATRARELFEDCVSRDAGVYSPLLGNRTMDALFRLACYRVGAEDLAGAQGLLRRSVVEAQRLVSGSWLNVCGDLARPLHFGLAELGQLVDRASRAAYALAVLETALQRPAVFAEQSKGWFERILDSKEIDLERLSFGNHVMRSQVESLNARVGELADLVVQKEARIHELGAEVAEQDRRAQELARRVRELSVEEPAPPPPPPPVEGRLRRWLRVLTGRDREA